MSAHDLIASLKQEGDLEARGEFKLDREKAREKMQKFQLPDPQRYVLELVQAAVILGATRVEFTLDADEMCVVFDGEPLDQSDLENLYNAPFSSLESVKNRALRHVAIGLTAARSLDLGVLNIESGLVDQTCELLYDPLTDTEQFRIPKQPWAAPKVPRSADGGATSGTRIYLKEKFRAGHLLEWVRKINGELAEHVYLHKHCHHTPIEVVLNGQRISHGWADKLTDEEHVAVAIDTEFERGVLWLRNRPSYVVDVLQNGVLVSQHTGFTEPQGFVAIVESSRLRKDLSQAAFIEDQAWTDLFETVLANHNLMALREKFRVLEASQMPPPTSEISDVLRHLVGIALEDRRRHQPSRPEVVEFIEKLVECPIWPVASKVDRRRAFWVGERVLVKWSDLQVDGSIPIASKLFSTVEFPKVVLKAENHDGVTFIGPLSKPEFEAYFDVEVWDATTELSDTHHRARNRTIWENTRWISPELEQGGNIAVQTQVQDLVINLIARPSANQSHIVWVKDGKLLSSTTLHGRFLEGLHVVIEGDIKPNARWDGPQIGDTYKTVVNAATELVPQLMNSVAASQIKGFSGLIESYVDSLVRGRLHREWFDAFGTDGAAEFLKAHKSPPWSLHVRASPDQKNLQQRVAGLGAVADVAMFPLLGGRTCSLADIARAIDTAGFQYTLHERHQKDILLIYHVSDDALPIVVTTDKLEALFLRLFGEHFKSAQSMLKRDYARRVFEQSPKKQRRLPGDRSWAYGAEHEHRYGDTVALVGMMSPSSGGPGIVVEVRIDGRKIDEMIVDYPIARIQAVVDSGDVNPRVDYYGILKDGARKQLSKELVNAADTLVENWMTDLLEKHELDQLPNVFWPVYTAAIKAKREWARQQRCFQEHEGERLTLSGVRAAVRFGHLFVASPGATIDETLVPEGRKVIVAGRSVPLASLVHHDLVDVSLTSENSRRAKDAMNAFMALPIQDLTVQNSSVCLRRVDVDQPGAKGQVGLLIDPKPHDTTRDSRLDLLMKRRFALTQRCFVPFGWFEGKLDTPNLKWSGGKWVSESDHMMHSAFRSAAETCLVEFLSTLDPGGESEGDVVHRMILTYLIHAVDGVNNCANVWPKAVDALKRFPIFHRSDGTWVSYLDLVQQSLIVVGQYVAEIPADVYGIVGDESTLRVLSDLEGVTSLFVSEYERSQQEQSDNTTASGDQVEASLGFSERARLSGEEAVSKVTEPEALRQSFTIEEFQVLGDLKALLTRARGEAHYLISDGHIDRIQLVASRSTEVVTGGQAGFLVNSQSALFQAASGGDRAAIWILASTTYSEINRFVDEISDGHEAQFQMQLTRCVADRQH